MSASGILAIIFGIFIAFLTLTPSKTVQGKTKGQLVWTAIQS
jgi:hypothetical protein